MHDELRHVVGLGFEEQRIHVYNRLLARACGLHGGGPRNLAAVLRDEGVEGHVLRFERGHAEAAVSEQTTQPGHERRLARIRTCPLQRDWLHYEECHRRRLPATSFICGRNWTTATFTVCGCA
jgi:hypothetical protein